VDRLGGRDLELAGHGVDGHEAIGLVTGEYTAGREVEQDEGEVTLVEERYLSMASRSRVILA
jgi:hypothetical protein